MLKCEFAKGSSSLQLTPEQEAAAQRLADAIAVKTKEDLLRITRLLVSKQDHELFGATEFEVRDLVHEMGARAIETARERAEKRGYQGSSMTCPHCGEAARCVGWRSKGVTCLLGWVQLDRHYYHCASCGQGNCPWDQTLRTAGHRLTPAHVRWYA